MGKMRHGAVEDPYGTIDHVCTAADELWRVCITQEHIWPLHPLPCISVGHPRRSGCLRIDGLALIRDFGTCGHCAGTNFIHANSSPLQEFHVWRGKRHRRLLPHNSGYNSGPHTVIFVQWKMLRIEINPISFVRRLRGQLY